MAELVLRKRHRLRGKEVRVFADQFEAAFGVRAFDSLDVDRAETGEMDVLVADQQILALVLPAAEGGVETCLPTVRGLLKWRPTKARIVVDMGAIPFVNNGADVMAPGIVDADAAVLPGAPVWICDERNKQPLAAGLALTVGTSMVRGKGKAVKTRTFVGDRFWNLPEPKGKDPT